MKRIAFATILIVIATVTSGWLTRQVAAAPGDIDPSFGLGGRVSFTNFAGRETAIQPDGKTLAAGSGSDGPNLKFNLMRFNPDGSPDVTFGTGGKAYTTNDGIELGANAVAIQPDGKIITAGNGDYYDNQGGGVVFGIGLARYNLDGSTDNNFGTGGKVFAAFDEADAHAVAVQSDGKIVVAGYTRYPTWGFLVLRYEVNGTPDLSFGVGGQVVTSFGGTADQARDVKLQADGKIVVAGVNGNGAFPNSTYNFALARYNPDGSLDSFFGDGGKIVTPFDDNFGANALALQADGKIVAVGGSGSDYHHGTALTRYESNGTLDHLFGTDGKVVTFGPIADANAVAIQPTGKIIAAGNGHESKSYGAGLVKYNADGSL
ncbi:MAG: delta-60 repeat domain-containing protein, partial [Pyrinomonadaceae bacterium]